MTSSKLRARKSGSPIFFQDICQACTKELLEMGITAEVYLIPGGVGVRFNTQRLPFSLRNLLHLPVKEFDFTHLEEFSLSEIFEFNLSGLILPDLC